MKEKGFTLIELLGVLIILAVLALLLTPTISKTLKSFKESAYEKQLEGICSSAQSWNVDNPYELLSSENGVLSITLGTLKNGGYVDYEIKDTNTSKLYPNDMIIELTKEEKNTKCKVITNTGNNRESYNIDAPLLSLKGSSTITIDVGSTYQELGFVAKKSTGLEMPNSSVTIEYYLNGNKVDKITTEEEKDYIVKYSVTDLNITTTIERTVLVRDITPPVITVNGKTSDFTITHECGTTFTVPTAIVTDNNKIKPTLKVNSTVNAKKVGTYTVTYTATDASNNVRTLILTVKVIDTINPTVAISGNPTSWTNQNVTLKVNASDSGSGLHSNAYSFNGGSSWQAGNTYIVSSNGTFNIWVRDNSGNITKNTIVVDKIDKTVPDMTFKVTSGSTGLNYWYKSNINVQMSPSAGGSGVKDYSYCVTTSDSCSPSTKVNGGNATTVTLSSESSTNKVCVTINSISGQTNTKCSSNYKIDKTSPVLTVGGHTSDYTITHEAGVTFTTPGYTVSDNLTSNPSVTRSGSVTPTVAGTYTLTYTAKDDAGNTKSIVVTVKVQVVNYTITYNLNGGTNNSSNPSSYHRQSNTITLANPTRTGYTFQGWYTDSALTNRVTSIPKGSSGNKVFYAKWIVNYYVLDVQTGDTNGWATVDVYINNSLVASNVTDYYASHPYGSTYRVVYKANTGYNVSGGSGSGSTTTFSGTITGNITTNASYAESWSHVTSDWTLVSDFDYSHGDAHYGELNVDIDLGKEVKINSGYFRLRTAGGKDYSYKVFFLVNGSWIQVASGGINDVDTRTFGNSNYVTSKIRFYIDDSNAGVWRYPTDIHLTDYYVM